MGAEVDLLERTTEARREVAAHKATIRRHRQALQHASAQLQALEAECRRRGIRLVIHEGAEGAIFHGREEDDPAPTKSPA